MLGEKHTQVNKNKKQHLVEILKLHINNIWKYKKMKIMHWELKRRKWTKGTGNNRARRVKSVMCCFHPQSAAEKQARKRKSRGTDESQGHDNSECYHFID